jgi:hypothetical protein
MTRDSIWGTGCIDLCFLNFSNSWNWEASFTSLPFNPPPPKKEPLVSLDRKLGGPQRASLDNMEKWKFLNLPGLECDSLSSPTCSQLLSRLSLSLSLTHTHIERENMNKSHSFQYKWTYYTSLIFNKLSYTCVTEFNSPHLLFCIKTRPLYTIWYLRHDSGM